MQDWLAEPLSQLKCQACAARQVRFDAEHHSSVTAADVPLGALRVMVRWSLTQQIARRNNSILCSPLARAPTAVRDPILDGEIERRAVGASLPPGDYRDIWQNWHA